MTRRTSYAVSWIEGDGPRVVGRLDLAQKQLRVAGRAGSDGETSRTVRYDQIAAVDTLRAGRHRLLTLLLVGGVRVVVDCLDRPGCLGELANELRARAANPHGESGVAPMPLTA